jgi:hypothetical protein
MSVSQVINQPTTIPVSPTNIYEVVHGGPTPPQQHQQVHSQHQQQQQQQQHQQQQMIYARQQGYVPNADNIWRGFEQTSTEQLPVWLSDQSLGGNQFSQSGMDAFLLPNDYMPPAPQIW